MDELDKLRGKFQSDRELLENIWINYPETREIREKLAYNKWLSLYKGERYNDSSHLSNMLNVLDIFQEFSYENEKLSTKLIKDIFVKIKEKYNPLLEKKQKESIANPDYKNDTNKEEEDSEIWQDIKTELENEFEIEYEKMQRIMKIFQDVSLFSQVGWDLSQFTREDMFVISKLNEVFDNRQEIKELLNNIGKIEKLEDNKKARAKKRTYESYPQELMGIKFGNDLSKLLPSELTLLHSPILKKYFYIKYNESRLLNYNMKSLVENMKQSKKKERGQGPIIMCIDNSSSMEGRPEEIAKGSALYILKKAHKEGRRVYLISFGSEGEISEYDLTNEKDGLYHALSFLRKKFFGGTDFIGPLGRSVELIKENTYQNADVLFISDGLAKLPKSFLTYINEAKDFLDFKIHSLIINSKEDKNLFSDSILFYNT